MSKDKTTDAPAPIYKMPEPPNQPIYQPRMEAPPPDAPRAPGAVAPDAIPGRDLLKGMQRPERPELPAIGEELQREVAKLREDLTALLLTLGDEHGEATSSMAAVGVQMDKLTKRVDDLQGLVGGMARDEQPTLERVSAIEKRVGELAAVVSELREELGDGGDDGS